MTIFILVLALMANGGNVRDGRTGVISHMGSGYPADYLALPIGPGHTVTICGERGCVTATSTDAGPNRQMLLAGRIADLSVELFSQVCGSPSMGLCEGSWRRSIPLPDTSTAP